MKIVTVVLSYVWKYVHNCGVTIVGDTNLVAVANKLDHYQFRKMRKTQEQYPFKNKILHIYLFFSRIDIKNLLKGAGVISSEKWENHKNSTVPILK